MILGLDKDHHDHGRDQEPYFPITSSRKYLLSPGNPKIKRVKYDQLPTKYTSLLTVIVRNCLCDQSTFEAKAKMDHVHLSRATRNYSFAH